MRQLVFALPLLVAFAGPVGAATFDFTLLASGVTVGQGDFSFPDADLSQPAVTQNALAAQSNFTSFDLSADGYTFTLSDLYQASYNPSSNSFAQSIYSPGGSSYIINETTDYFALRLKTNFFTIGGNNFEPCYVYGECGPNYPSVFEGYTLVINNSSDRQVYGVNFDTFLITPVTTVSEPGSALLLLTSLAGLGLLVRSNKRQRETI